MSLFKAVKSVFGGGRSDSGSEDRLCVVDGERMTDGREAGPGDRFQVLQRLGKFVEREKIRMQVVFSGRPLREADNGSEFMGIKVLYVEQGQNYVDQFLAFTKDALRKDSVLVITNDVEMEKRAIELGAATLRASTLRKAFESSEGGGERDFRGGGGGDRGPRRRGGRGPRRGPPGGGRPPQQGGGGDSGAGQSDRSGGGESSQPSGGQSQVKNLIDLVE